MKKKIDHDYSDIHVDLHDYHIFTYKSLLATNLAFMTIVISLLFAIILLDVSLVSQIIMALFIIIFCCGLIMMHVSIQTDIIKSRKARLVNMFKDIKDLNSVIYENTVIRSFHPDEIDEICLVDNKLHIRVDHIYQSIDMARHDENWIVDLAYIQSLRQTHYAHLICRHIREDIDESDFEKVLPKTTELTYLLFTRRED